tara:strand:- start:537 stop:1460 length:924 start_codon:yes stop_codon:yes gene_type:complete
MKTLIIGSEGYIGSALMRFFTCFSVGDTVDGLDICWFGQQQQSTIKKDYKDLTEKELEEYDVIILLAGHSSVPMCSGGLDKVLANNLYNFTNLLSKLERLSKKIKLIYASSSSVYGSTGSTPARENEINFSPHNNYDIVKYMADLAAQRYDVEYYGLRFGTVNGFSPVMRDDIMINAMVSTAKRTDQIKLFGAGTCRPILGINDLCRAVAKIISHDEDARGFYNLASFNTTSSETAHAVSEIVNVPVKVIKDDGNASSYSFAISTEKFKDTFDFSFQDSIDSICREISTKYTSITLTNRREPKPYEL